MPLTVSSEPRSDSGTPDVLSSGPHTDQLHRQDQAMVTVEPTQVQKLGFSEPEIWAYLLDV